MKSFRNRRTDMINAAQQRYDRALENDRKIAFEWKITLESLKRSENFIYLDSADNPIGFPKEVTEKNLLTLCRIMWNKENVDLPPNNNLTFLKRMRKEALKQRKLDNVLEMISNVKI